MSKITVCIFGAENATRAEIIAALNKKLDNDILKKYMDISSGRFRGHESNVQEVEKDTGQIRLFMESDGRPAVVGVSNKGEILFINHPTDEKEKPAYRDRLLPLCALGNHERLKKLWQELNEEFPLEPPKNSWENVAQILAYLNCEKLSDIPSVGRLDSQKPNKSQKPQHWTPHKGERVACYQEGDRVYKVLPFHTATNGNFCPTEHYYDHIRRYSGQESMRVAAISQEPEYRG